MAMDVGTVAAVSGLTMEIYNRIDGYLSPPLAAEPDALADARAAWRQLSHAIADGVITHLTEHLEVIGVQTGGDVVVTSAGTSAGAEPTSGHTHALDIADGDLSGVFDQVGSGRVR